MANLYDFPNQESFDYRLLNGEPFKCSRKKITILKKPKNGKYN